MKKREVQKGKESQAVIITQSCPLSVEINISCFSPNTYQDDEDEDEEERQNISENLWKELTIRVHRRDPRNLQYLKPVCVCLEEWAKIPP